MTAPVSHLEQLSPPARQELEAWLHDFEQNWGDQLLAARAAAIAADHPLRQAALIEMAKIDLERRWRHGKKPLLESYLKRFPELGTADTVPADLLLAECRVRCQFGQAIDQAEYARRFPRQSPELQALLARESDPSRATTPTLQRSATTQTQMQAPAAAGGAGPDLPEQFGRYRILKKLGQGGMGAVYLAHDSELDRQVALKVPRFSAGEEAAVRERFTREARAAATLNHPNICPLHDVGVIDGTLFVTMAYIDGKTLSALVPPDKGLPQKTSAALVRKLALAMHEAHAAGVIHRDLKPANIMVNRRKEPVVMDFGLARRLKVEDARLTRTGSIVGTPAYMSPEQVQGDPAGVGPATDIYSLGVILYECLTGRLPFEGPLTAVFGQVLTQAPEPPSKHRRDLDPALEAVCLKAMAKKPADRHPSMQALADALSDYLKGAAPAPGPETLTARPGPPPIPTAVAVPAPPPPTSVVVIQTPPPRSGGLWTFLAAAVLLLLVVVGGYLLLRNPTPPIIIENKNEVIVRLDNLPPRGDTTIVYVLDGKQVPREQLEGDVKVELGDHLLVIQRDGKEIDRRVFTARKDNRVAVLLPPPGPNGDKGPAETGWEQLFNGKDLSGWTNWPDTTLGWVVKDGALVSDGPVIALYSPYGHYKNFHLRFEAMVNDKGSGGLFFRSNFKKDVPYGYLAQIDCTADLKRAQGVARGGRTGGLYRRGGSSFHIGTPTTTSPVRAGEWFTEEVIADGNSLKVVVDGKTVLEEVATRDVSLEGFFALHRDSRDTILKFRKIEVKELPPPRPVVRPGAEAGWVQLFNKKDLAGWKGFRGVAGWEVKDGVLIGKGPVNALFTERGDYENFHLRVEARVNAGGLASQLGRARFMEGNPYGYLGYIGSTHSYEFTGVLYSQGGTNYHLEDRWIQTAKVKPDTWFVQELIAKGNHLELKLNGESVSNAVDQRPEAHTRGHLALHRYTPETVVEYRVVEVREK